MKKLLISTLLLSILDISLIYYLKDIELSKKTFEFNNIDDIFIIQRKDILLNNTDDFILEDYFTFLSFDEVSYIYTFDENIINIKVKDTDNIYKYDYELIEPKVIEKEVIKYETVYVENQVEDIQDNVINNNTSNEVIQEEIIDNKIHYNQSYYSFSCGTDISTIIQEISSDIECYDNVTVSYASLNPYICGVYEVYFYSSADNITKTIEII